MAACVLRFVLQAFHLKQLKQVLVDEGLDRLWRLLWPGLSSVKLDNRGAISARPPDSMAKSVQNMKGV